MWGRTDEDLRGQQWHDILIFLRNNVCRTFITRGIMLHIQKWSFMRCITLAVLWCCTLLAVDSVLVKWTSLMLWDTCHWIVLTPFMPLACRHWKKKSMWSVCWVTGAVRFEGWPSVVKLPTWKEKIKLESMWLYCPYFF